MRRPLIYLTALLLASMTLPSGAQTPAEGGACELPVGVTLTPPGTARPVPISIGLYLLDLTDVDDVSQTFSAQVAIVANWTDPRLSSAALGWSPVGCRFPIADVWNPEAGILNQVDLTFLWPQTVEVDDEGQVRYRQRLLGVFSSPVDLRDFPYDSQILPLRVTSFRYDDKEVSMVLDPARTGMLDSMSVSGWLVELADAVPSREVVAAQQRAFSGIDFRLAANRDVGFYLYKVVLPLSLIVLMAWTVFWIDPTHMPPQVGVSTAAVLTLIAFQFSLIQLLPRVSYLTRIDRFLMWSTVLVFGALGEAILTGRLANTGREELGRRIDRHSRWIYLCLFALVWVGFLRPFAG